jgi:hypothetical protein
VKEEEKKMNSLHPENPAQTEKAVTVPIDATGSVTAVVARQLILQAVLVVGVLVGALGLSETSTIVKAVRFLQSESAVPLIGAIAALGSSIYLQIRAKRKHQALQTLSLLPSVPDTVAKGPENPTPSVEKAVMAAIALSRRFR